MKKQPGNPIAKNPVVLSLAGVVIVLFGIIFFMSQKSTATPPAAQNTSPDEQPAVSENPQYGEVHALFKNPSDNTFLMGSHKGLFRSTDEGKTFSKAETTGVMDNMEFMNFAYDPNSKTLFAGGHDLGVVKSMDGGISWAKSDSGIQGTDIHALAVNPLETSSIYAFSVSNGVFGSKDGGKIWNRIDDGPANPSVRSFGYMGTASPMDKSMGTDNTTNIGYLWAGTGGGLYSSFACFCGWTKTSGISDTATIYTLAPDPVNKSRMLAGTRDGVFKTTDEGKTFSQIYKDIKNVAGITFDQTDPKAVYLITSEAGLFKSTDSGDNWEKLN